MQTSHPALDLKNRHINKARQSLQNKVFLLFKTWLLLFEIWSSVFISTPQKPDKPAGSACIEMHSTLFSVFTFIWRKTIKIYLLFLLATSKRSARCIINACNDRDGPDTLTRSQVVKLLIDNADPIVTQLCGNITNVSKSFHLPLSQHPIHDSFLNWSNNMDSKSIAQ